MKRAHDAIEDDGAAEKVVVAPAFHSTVFNGRKSIRALGAGDSAYYVGVFDADEARALFDACAPREVVVGGGDGGGDGAPATHNVNLAYDKAFPFTMMGKRLTVPRWKAFVATPRRVDLGAAGVHTAWPEYRYEAGDPDVQQPYVVPEHGAVEEMPDVVRAAIKAAAARANVPAERYNHVVLNYYAGGRNHIGYHRDKTRDLSHTLPVLTVTLLDLRDAARTAPRTLTLQRQGAAPRATQRVALRHGSVFVLGACTNGTRDHCALGPDVWKHRIDLATSAASQARVAPRLSLTCRAVDTRTVVVGDTKYAYGPGSKRFPTLDALRAHLSERTAECE